MPQGPEDSLSYLFSWRGVPVGRVTLRRSAGQFTYVSRHLHTRGGQVGERKQEVTLALSADGTVEGTGSVPQALWLWRGPPRLGCVTGREELTGREGVHCLTASKGREAEGTLLGVPFRARYDAQGWLEVLEVGESRFTRAAPGEKVRPPPELFAQGVPVQGRAGALAFEPAWPVPERLPGMTEWEPGAARALAARVHAAFPEKGPGAADWRAGGEGEAGGCLAHALRFAAEAQAQGHRVALVHGLLVLEGGAARPHAWVRVALVGGGLLELDPTSLDAVRAETHLALALVDPRGAPVEAGERWLELLRGTHRVVRVP
ncbi:transglutaminase domain-containing protein [Stigmatella sp. ncwal1]|uniref:Transglutaminase domain-containing protein n=1 Tax=Stigmatella ashevillensis TaxID=2995309 RepID=A0ABT5DBZ2_9BACT|nr:transglutaminase domain-containing protein [Stigmatella ashevillena]MDC0710574.1 transglutaminase domain-containing protein [Stigmatella ashevillena]